MTLKSSDQVPSLILVTVLASMIGCGGSGDLAQVLDATGEYDTTGAATLVIDSFPDDLPVWLIGEPADLRIGSVDGAGPDAFGRIGGIVTTSDGDLVLLDFRDSELKSFGRDGDFRWRAGGRGEGPGEFMIIAGLMRLPGDTIAVLDRVPPRAQLFAPDGAFIRTISRRSDDAESRGETEFFGVLDDGTIAATVSSRQGSIIKRDYRRLIDGLVIVGMDGAVLHSGPKFFQEPLFSEIVSVDQGGKTIRAMVMRPPGIAHGATYAARGSRVAVGVQSSGEILLYDQTLAPVLRVLLPTRGVAVDKDRYLAHVAATSEETSAASEKLPFVEAAARLPTNFPAFNRLRLDGVGRIWVEEYVPPYETRVPIWWILGPDGNVLARTTMPTGFAPRQIDGGEIIGVATDDLGVQFVERRKLTLTTH